jgi:hypothetical protein
MDVETTAFSKTLEYLSILKFKCCSAGKNKVSPVKN